MIRSQIVSVGAYVPDRVVTNKDLEKLMDTSDEWIFQRTGIRERRWGESDVCSSNLGLKAAEQAIANANLPKENIDCLIFATLSPDHEFPGNACFLQAKMGLGEIPAIDVRQQCSGFLYSLAIADSFIRTGMYKTILIVGAEVHSRGLDISTRGRDVSVLFGDGAGAVVVQAVDVQNEATDSYIFSTELHADGTYAKELWAPAPGCGIGSGLRMTHEMISEGLSFPQMNGRKVFTHAVKKMAEVLVESLQKNRVSIDQIDLFLFHQANLRINEAVADILKIPASKIFNTIHKYGNTTAATIPLGMRDAVDAGVLKKGMTVAMTAFGSGFTWGSALLRY